MYNKLDQKELEKRAVLQYLKEKDIAEELLKPSERPDFILTLGEKKIFLEHTEMMNRRGQEDRDRDARVSKLLKTAKEKYQEKYTDDPVSVEVEFVYEYRVKPADVERYCSELIDFVYQNKPKQGERTELHSFQHEIDQIDSIRIYNMHEFAEYTSWREDRVRLYGALRKEEFVMPVQKKNEKAIKAEWSEKFDEAWLFLHTGRRHAAYADFEVPSTWVDGNWVFTKIILYDGFGDIGGKYFKELNI